MFGRSDRRAAREQDATRTRDLDDRPAGKGTSSDTSAPGDRHAPRPRSDGNATARFRGGIVSVSRWALRLLIIAAALYALSWIVGRLWSILLPILLALLLSTVLWPPTRWLRRRMPPALAASITVVGLLAVIAGVIALLAPAVSRELPGLVERTSAGLASLQQWLAGPPFNLGSDALGGLVDQAIASLQSNSQAVANAVLASLGTISNAVINLVLALVLAFFFLKDGPKFLPWLRRWIGAGPGRHVEAVSGRIWTGLGQFVWSQAAVAFVDAIFIGLGVWILGVPFPLPIAVLTFFGGFVPIIGAFVAGAVAVLVALVSNGFGTALGVLAIVLVVQQLEGNVLQPILVGRTLKMHPAVVIGVVALGSTLFGIVGAFLAVPATTIFTVIAQYLRRQIVGPEDDSGEPAPPAGPPDGGGSTPLTHPAPDDPDSATPPGTAAAGDSRDPFGASP